MKRYGLRIGDAGVEFSSKDERDKALLCFTKGATVKVNTSSGVRYKEEGDPSFGTYERESNEVLTNCCKCHGTFAADSCTEREYPSYCSWNKKFEMRTEFICDGCFAKAKQDADLAEARARLEAAGQA